MKNLWKLLLAVCMISAFAACSDGDDDRDIAELTGTYNGYTVAEFSPAGDPMEVTTPGETVRVTVNEDNKTATVTLTSSVWGEIKFTNVSVIAGTQYFMLGATGNVEMESQHSDPQIYKVNMSAIVVSTTNAVFQYQIPELMKGPDDDDEGTLITFVTGSVPAE